MSQAPVPSPCNRVCAMDPSGTYCTGCQRTLDEIGRWAALSDAERREIVAKLDARRRQLAAGALPAGPSSAP